MDLCLLPLRDGAPIAEFPKHQEGFAKLRNSSKYKSKIEVKTYDEDDWLMMIPRHQYTIPWTRYDFVVGNKGWGSRGAGVECNRFKVCLKDRGVWYECGYVYTGKEYVWDGSRLYTPVINSLSWFDGNFTKPKTQVAEQANLRIQNGEVTNVDQNKLIGRVTEEPNGDFYFNGWKADLANSTSRALIWSKTDRVRLANMPDRLTWTRR
jgi:hypothetical protein